ncbi:hypothetical protein MCOR27_006224 [Pyricularia oryzae]|nr:hypothetical protein MCOR27_006224 [Pyricularia oryzae]KAI6291265.1 hypothetical protein MCOR34_010234 [Pyricularia oryzae]KAI6320972.1 hypothetical protein MCOR29_005104 [Pyricularia oryzae]KAI6324665.1 hypothetical protein MCOR30_007035 [Pyricularia oryzae]KAI6384926.1 hypothetical protein MCOR32_001763 [Pyricularia oryzae]
MRKSNSPSLSRASDARTPRLRPTHPPESSIAPLDLAVLPKKPTIQPLHLDYGGIPELDIGEPIMDLPADTPGRLSAIQPTGK